MNLQDLLIILAVVVIILAVVVLIAFGGKRLTEFGKRLGEGINDHRGGAPSGPKAA